MIHKALLLSLLFRSLWLLIPQTYFQPDEFYQALEPAHHHVFGYGHLTWEWRDLPSSSQGSWWGDVVEGGRMRSWFWPSLFVGVYQLLRFCKLDDTFLLVVAPRIIGVFVAAMTDWYTYRLSSKLIGEGSAAGALFLSLTSLFNAHLLPRALSTSPETMLTTMALTYFPLPPPEVPSHVPVDQVGSENRQNEKVPISSLDGTAGNIVPSNIEKPQEKQANKHVEELNYIVMDRMRWNLRGHTPPKDSLILSVALATTAICIRPTTLPFWAYMGVELLARQYKYHGVLSSLGTMVTSAITVLMVLAASTAIDYHFTGRLVFPILTFFHRNIFLDISSFYGSTTPFYHLTQSIPIMLFPTLPWVIPGFISCLFPSSHLPSFLIKLDRPPGLRILARSITFSITILSLSPHSEWRFLHPFLPPLLLFAIAPLVKGYIPNFGGCYHFRQSIRQYCRFPKIPFYVILLLPILPFAYLNLFHGRAQVEVMNVLRTGKVGQVTGVVGLMPCHSTPWMSHLHRNVPAWFLTCEPPLREDHSHITQQQVFYWGPITYLENVFPHSPISTPHTSPRGSIPHFDTTALSHIILFGELLERRDSSQQDDRTVRETLVRMGYEEVWQMWNGFDLLQDEPERRGGVRIWRRMV
ncbi:hypothetical protein M231_06071 [Tremella mesenterica]|uniref:Mannosyltransferase n=1 Tax=Tremella mesenterica TaxID=5217 RepID=A0A4Q1BGJ9_TREME|nr:hypothetical protein M231_06071 [Tremella mesenterica]